MHIFFLKIEYYHRISNTSTSSYKATKQQFNQ